MNNKKCTECQEIKPATTEFFLKEKLGKYGIRSKCKICMRELTKLYKEQDVEKIKNRNEKILQSKIQQIRTCTKCNETKLATSEFFYRSKGILRGDCKVCNEKQRNNFYHSTEKFNPKFKTINSLRRSLRFFLNGTNKSKRTQELLGCTQDQLMEHLESQFDQHMSWDNQGSYWHMDHIIPCSSYNTSVTGEQEKCFNYRNLRPLKGVDNISKGNSLDMELITQYGIEDLLPINFSKSQL